MTKRILIIAGIIISIMLIGGGVFYFVSNEKLPKGSNPEKADVLAEKMLDALNHNAWDTTQYVAWDFNGMHSYFWDKKRDWVEITYDDLRILLKTRTQTGKVYKDGMELGKQESADYLNDAWTYFCNDSFWLIAPYKCFDEGTKRLVVNNKTYKNALLVTYTTGGTTPGDSYLWLLDDKYMPYAFKMWVKVIPLGGVESSWEDWKTTATGAKIASVHKMGSYTSHCNDIKTGNTLESMGKNEDPFAVLQSN